MSHIDTYFDQTYLKAGQLDGQDQTYTIEEITRDEVVNPNGKAHKPVVRFAERKEKLVLNKTNSRRIAAMYGTDVSTWIGKTITLYPTECEAWGETRECIRVRENHGPTNKPKS